MGPHQYFIFQIPQDSEKLFLDVGPTGSRPAASHGKICPAGWAEMRRRASIIGILFCQKQTKSPPSQRKMFPMQTENPAKTVHAMSKQITPCQVFTKSKVCVLSSAAGSF